jgi:hypothetical protein
LSVVDSRPSSDAASESATERPSSPWWRRSWKAIVGILGAFGILGAIGGYLVNAIGPDVEETLRGGGSVGISIQEDPQGGSDGFRAAARSPRGLDAALGQATDCASLFLLAKGAGAVDVGRSLYNAVLEGRTHRDVAITDMRAKILKRTSPLTGAEISCQSAGALDAIGVGFNLDEPDPRARKINDFFSDLGALYFGGGNVVTLRKAEVQPVQIAGFVSRDYVEWEIHARAVIDGKEEELIIDNNGEPFRLTGAPPKSKGAPQYGRYYEWIWYEMPQRLYNSDLPVSEATSATKSTSTSGTGGAGLPGSKDCGGVSANSVTTCRFARDVKNTYYSSGRSSRVTVHSDATGLDYEMSCTSGSPHVCTGGNGAEVRFD